MELVYVYIKEYRNLKNVEFNFSQNKRLHYNLNENTIVVEDSDSHLPNGFWGENISNLNLIVGNNGLGKTTIMQFIIDIYIEMFDKEKLTEGKGFIVFGDNSDLYGYISDDSEELPEVENCIIEWLKVHNEIMPEIYDKLFRTKLIYMTNALSQKDYQRGNNYAGDRYKPVYDCSMGGLIAIDTARDKEYTLHSGNSGISELTTYFNYEQYKQIKFVFDRNQFETLKKLKKDGYPVPLPKKLYIDALKDNQFDKVFNIDENIKSKLDEKLSLQIAKNEQDLVRFQLSNCTVGCFVRSIARCMDDEQKLQFKDKLLKMENSKDISYETLTNEEREACYETLINKVSDAAIDSLINKQELFSNIKSYSECCSEFLKFVNKELSEEYFTKISYRDEPNFESNYLSFYVETENSEWFIDFLQKYRYVCELDYFLDFHWGLSSGECNLLSMFSSLYYIFDADHANINYGGYKIYNYDEYSQSKDKRIQCKSVFLLIDEADLTYHPEWQREYISILTAFLPKIYPKECCENIQILLSTHSPILLGDMPSQNVFYLKIDADKGCIVVDTNKHIETFGQNVHILFRDGFFLENGTIGRFAMDKIKKLLKELNNIEKDLKEKTKTPQECDSILRTELIPYAELIGEPIVRRKVMLMINDVQKKIDEMLLHDNQKDYSKLSDEEIRREIDGLTKERNRRNNDTD